MSTYDCEKLPSGLGSKFASDPMKRSLEIARTMIHDRGYKYKVDTKSKHFEVYRNGKDIDKASVMYLIPLGLINKESISKEMFINIIYSNVDHATIKPYIIILSYLPGSNYVNEIIETANFIADNDGHRSDILGHILSDTSSSKGMYSYIYGWIIAAKPKFEWILVDEIPQNFTNLIPRHKLDNDYTGSTMQISSSELIVRYNMWNVGDIVKIYRDEEPPVWRKITKH
jgi:hypothetical protein